ncbi:linear amide C-N hydrolase [Azospirillum sp.]|uniref:linear amide C-N hydrolase n=1 Tax=Azospirillum sp. TaxID=34012 RepID=UPI002D66B055|nr:linear amide C-N hydrolase [Azospirillum sp.]HYD64076.1 linear amide C-N hydrolase [Azospirillum sp.]
MSHKKALIGLALVLGLAAPAADACTRIFYKGAKGYPVIARSLDWTEDTSTDIWAYPRGMKRDGGIDAGSIRWTSRFGSVTASLYDMATVDGMNEAGLMGNMLYLGEAEYDTKEKDKEKANLPTLSVGAWLQYALDNFATVAEAVKALKEEPFRVIAPPMPTGDKAGAHLALSDISGDTAIFEYIGGKLVIHHGRDYGTMTNSPTFDQQLAINTYWKDVGSTAMLPGTHRAADRFVRADYYVNAADKYDDTQKATAAALSVIRAVSVPIGIKDPQKPNIATTIWRTAADPKAKRYYYESAWTPSVMWVNIGQLDLSEGTRARRLALKGHPDLSGDVTGKFVVDGPFPWLTN